MVTSTIYSDSQTVVIDVGSVPATAPWLEQTTYLIDQSGYTTAVLAQTDQPTPGVTLAPVPYPATPTTTAPTPTSVTLTPVPYTTTPTTTVLTLTLVTGRTPMPAVTVAGTVIGVVAGIALTLALVCYLRQRIRSNRLRSKFLLHTSQAAAQAWPPAGRDPSWEEFLKETEEYAERFDESTVLSSEGNGSGLGDESYQGGYRRTYVASAVRCSPSTIAPAQAHLGQPTSILKRPAPLKIANMAQGTFETEDEQDNRDVPATRKLALAKKGVRFGIDQIREFGRTPFGSTAGSVVDHGSEI
ncbi:MAG: hypothetical protein ALECFALPRED_003004 [Alectoria fallacina]|uniref:Uncharacterized protein n=1 Tax=Alectoria fallacina TaxID=1903189 RepID=A0A8H3EEM5_9LECA|nr:MAG: hypothetical protein ALECFALPRED_003004 [Alectoria fallacina]